MRLREIAVGIYVSGHTCHTIPGHALGQLRSKQIKHVFCLAGGNDTTLSEALRGTYHYHPLSDGKLDDNNILDYWKVADEIVAVAAHENVLVHCRAGRNRSCFVVALALLKIIPSLSGKDVLDLIRTKRPNAIVNLSFEKYLLEYER